MSFIHSFYLSDISDANLAGLLSNLRLKLSGLPVISNVMLTERSCSNLFSPKDTPSTTAEQEKSDRLHIYNTSNYLAKSNIHKKRQGLSKGSPKSKFLLFPVFPIFIYLLIYHFLLISLSLHREPITLKTCPHGHWAHDLQGGCVRQPQRTLSTRCL